MSTCGSRTRPGARSQGQVTAGLAAAALDYGRVVWVLRATFRNNHACTSGTRGSSPPWLHTGWGGVGQCGVPWFLVPKMQIPDSKKCGCVLLPTYQMRSQSHADACG
jgi:hypothetical protein